MPHIQKHLPTGSYDPHFKGSIDAAYFSMEFAFDHRIPNYAGGLGVLAADYMLALADKKAPVVGVSLIYHQSSDEAKKFDPSKFMTLLDVFVYVAIEERLVKVGVYEYTVLGQEEGSIPLYFLSTNFPENPEWDRDLTKNLYPNDGYTRLAQEAILGIGGVRMLRALAYKDVKYFHMNEGHASFLTLELLKENNFDDAAVKKIARFTTHTPVAAGHDYFDYELSSKVLGDMMPWHIDRLATSQRLSMTHLALNLSGKSNAVAAKHCEVCQDMFPDYEFQNITNAVHHVRWAAPGTKAMLDKALPDWRMNPTETFGKVKQEISAAAMKTCHKANKKRLITWLNKQKQYFAFDDLQTDDLFDEKTLTIGFARRLVPYKRTTLIFRDLARLRKLGYKKIQLVFAGNAQGGNTFGQSLVRQLNSFSHELRGQVRVVMIPDYSVGISDYLISGCDVWLNNPIIPREASGTSGMKASLNGLLNLSIPDGWWIEGAAMEPLSGWTFGGRTDFVCDNDRDNYDADELYKTLVEVMDCYYNRQVEWTERQIAAMSLMRFFNGYRAMDDYYEKMWTP